MFCPNCGAPIEAGDTWCRSCETPLDPERVAALTAETGREVGVYPPQPPAPEAARPAGQPPVPAGRSASAPPPPAGAASPGALNDSRQLLSYILLSLVTCGIYGYYFLYKLVGDVNVACADDGEETPGIGIFILLSFLTLGLYAFWWHYKLGNRLQANAPRYGLSFQESGTTLLVWDVVGIVVCGLGVYVTMHIIIKNSNALFGAYNAAHGLVWQG